jgi:hypothetical protein
MGEPNPSTPVRPERAGWWSSRRASGLALALGEALLETLPVTIWLQTAATFLTGDPGVSALPFWYALAVVAAAGALGRALRRSPPGVVLLAALPALAIAVFIAFRISPAAYGGVPGGPLDTRWLAALGGDLARGAPALGNLLGLVILTSYLVWRGLLLGLRTPTLDTVRTKFIVSFAVVLAAVTVAAIVPFARGQALLTGRLALLLPFAAFVGLATLALARSAAAPDAGGFAGQSGRRPWLSLALALAGIILGVALVLSVVFSYDNLLAALDALGPIGQALVVALEWLAYGIAYLLFLILNGVVTFIQRLSNQAMRNINPPPPPPAPHVCPKAGCPIQQAAPLLTIIAVVLAAIVVLALIVLLVYIIYRSLRLLRGRMAQTDEYEERESLDARALLGAQLRGLFQGLFQRRAPASAEEPLPVGSVRYVYREVLRVAAALGLGRRSAETPDEYALRLAAAGASAETEGDLAALTSAYDQARYGEVEPEDERQRDTRTRGERIVAWLRRWARDRSPPG